MGGTVTAACSACRGHRLIFPLSAGPANAVAPASQPAMPSVTESDDDGSAADHYSVNLVAPSPSPHHSAALADDGTEDADPYALAAQSLPSGWRKEEVMRLLNRDDADALMRATVYVGHNNVSVAAVIDTGSGPSWINSDTLRRIDAGITEPRLRCPTFTRARAAMPSTPLTARSSRATNRSSVDCV